MIDLHLHLDGSLTPDDIIELATSFIVDIPEEAKEVMNADDEYDYPAADFIFSEIGEEFGSDETEEEDSYYYTASDVEEDFDDSDI